MSEERKKYVQNVQLMADRWNFEPSVLSSQPMERSWNFEPSLLSSQPMERSWNFEPSLLSSQSMEPRCNIQTSLQQSQPKSVRRYLLSFLKQSEPTAGRWCFLPSIPKMNSLFRVKKFFRQGLAVLVVLTLLLLQQGCLKDLPENLPTDYVWKPLFAFPIGEAEFGLKIPSGFDTRLLQTDTLTGFPYWTALEKIPMEGAVSFDFGRVLGNRDEINMAVLRLNAYNGFPVEVKIQAYLEDAFGNVLDSLFTPVMTIKRGKLSAGGETLQHAHTMEEVYFDQERLDLLLRVKWIVFRGELQNVIFFPQYTFSVQMGAVLGIITEF